MKTASLHELKKELSFLAPSKVLEICIKLAKYKKDNKELLTYLLFEAHDEHEYIKNVKEVIDEQFAEMNKSNFYIAKKTIRKVLKTANKYIKYSGVKQTEIELLIYYCQKLKNSGIALNKSTTLTNLYQRQIMRINKALANMHEDLQYDYNVEIKLLLI